MNLFHDHYNQVNGAFLSSLLFCSQEHIQEHNSYHVNIVVHIHFEDLKNLLVNEHLHVLIDSYNMTQSSGQDYETLNEWLQLYILYD